MPSKTTSLTTSELLAQLTRRRPEFRDEASAPPVDRELLRRLVRGELSDAETRAASLLVHSFKTWDEAHTLLLVEHYRATCRQSDATDAGAAAD